MTALAHASARRRGACPGLSAPMPTGDGLLVRLQPNGTIALAAFTALCAAARRYGNGIVEVTARGNVQIRGLSEVSAPRFAAAVAALDIAAESGIAVVVGPLAGLDRHETIDPRPFAESLRHALARSAPAARLSAKTSIAIESGGALDPTHVPADIRLSARREGTAIVFDLALGGDRAGATPLGAVADRDASAAVLRLLDVLAVRDGERRMRDVVAAEGPAPFRAAVADRLLPARRRAEPLPACANAAEAIGIHPLRDGSFACGIGLAFGHCDAATLERLSEAAAAAGACGLRTAPGRALLAIGVPRANADAFAAAAGRLGFVTRAGDPRAKIVACAGAPICASAHIAARALAPQIAGLADFPVHISGCAKGCAHPAPAPLTVVGTPAGCALVAGGTARDAPFAVVTTADLSAAVARFARERRDGQCDA